MAAPPQPSSSAAATGPSTTSDTLDVLTVIQNLSLDALVPNQQVHPFSASQEASVASLRKFIESTSQASQSLTTHLPLPFADTKLLSLFRQYTTIAHNVHTSDQIMRQTVKELRKRSGITYGEEIPLDRTTLVNWCISRLESWGAAAGMETFREESTEGQITVMLAGKVLVVDVDFSVDRSDAANPRLGVAGVKTSYAVPNGAVGTTTEGSASLDGFIADGLSSFLEVVQKPEDEQDPIEAARIGSCSVRHLQYLMRLDKLALREGDNGLRWFNSMDRLALEVVEPFAVKEAQAVASSLSGSPAPLDIFLMRGHTLPLPYLRSPSMSFLVHLSPLAYLTLLRTPPPPSQPTPKSPLPSIDIPFHTIRSRLTKHPHHPGATIATLVLATASTPSPTDSLGMHSLASRPVHTLTPMTPPPDYHFFETTDPPGSPTAGTAYRWLLDFTDDGSHRGVVMSQSRMREIETIVNPLSGIDASSNVPLMGFGMGSWVDLLLNPNGSSMQSERYTALYVSPNSVHPPLQLRLSSPDEPGLLLERIPVQNIKQVWGILEIVREQCWLNEIICGCKWVVEGSGNSDAVPDDENEDVNETDLQAILTGSITPRKIPVNIYLPTQPPHDPLFDAPSLDPLTLSSESPRQTRIIMTSPERHPITGLVEISVAYDATRPRGVSVSVNGAMGADVDAEALEEVCRRGGVLGLPGRVWKMTHVGPS
ncbi:hypothetical protein BXZ70DRAFT_1001486 [Cristinia sonorae]|uniref:Mediator complex subunit 1 n=1 Tax=Cristinia sonorae TaxID=1940300 RepID=A0A8K0XMJ5_9AGAR|nr:hypothetical protein BXZ70DRAFT_1001486 [Cristinia sonorae]